MSCNYAEGLSAYENKGKLGIAEVFDDDKTVEEKTERLAEMILKAKHVVVHTGAGISTSAGIPDFRGPKGVWTLEEKGLKPDINISFDNAKPTETHMGLVSLMKSGHIKYVISQNIDGLHLRSGMKRSCISELHGSMFVAACSYCEREFIRPNSVPTVGQKEIGLDCPWIKAGGRICRGKLRDNILDWEHNLPEKDLEMADMHSTLADLSICLGSTLQVTPAGNLPLKAKKNGGKVVIVNLQPTKHHKKADLVIHTYVDVVIKKLFTILGINIPLYTSDIDPTCILRGLKDSLSVKSKASAADWTISSKDVSKLKNMVATLKGNKPKKTTVSRKRKRPSKHEDSSDFEEYLEEKNFAEKKHVNDSCSEELKFDSDGTIKLEADQEIISSEAVETTSEVTKILPPVFYIKTEEIKIDLT